MAHEKIVTAFHQVQQAEAARVKLIGEGIEEKNIDIISGERLKVEGKEIRHPSFWQRLFGDDVDEDNASEYNKAIQTGGVLLTVRVPEDQASYIEQELSAFAADPSLTGTGQSSLTGKDFAGETDDSLLLPDAGDDTRHSSAIPAQNLAAGQEDALKLAEEHVDIGKRKVSDGTVRLRRYTVQDDVSEDVSLYDQHAEVFRRAVDEPAYLSDVDWSDKTIAVEESHEVPTVSKTARVKEEVGLREEETARVETVKDSVRRQEVAVENTDTLPKPADDTGVKKF